MESRWARMSLWWAVGLVFELWVRLMSFNVLGRRLYGQKRNCEYLLLFPPGFVGGILEGLLVGRFLDWSL